MVVLVLVVVARHLLLQGSGRESLDVRMKETSTIPIVFDADFRSECHLQGRVGEIVANEMRLEKGAHLCVAGPGPVQNDEVDLETCGIYGKGQDNEAADSRQPVFDIRPLCQISQFLGTAFRGRWH